MPVTHAKSANTTLIPNWTQADIDAQIAKGNLPSGTVPADVVLFSDWNTAHTISVNINEINATGTPSSTSFLRGDGQWAGAIPAMPDGTAAAPGLPFTDDADTGIYRPTTDTLAFSTGGLLRMQLTTTSVTPTLPIYGLAGTVAAPSYSFSPDPDTGMYRTAADTIGFSAGNNLSFEVGNAVINAYTPITLPQGSAAAPSYAFSGDLDTGIYSAAGNNIQFSTNGVERAGVGDSNFNFSVPIYAQNGAFNTPSVTFTSDPDTGLYRPAADTIGFSTAGLKRFEITPTGTLEALVDGTVAAPVYTWDGDADTGLYRAAANILGITTNGAGCALFTTTGMEIVNAGSAANPSFTWDGDENTGLYRPAANELSVTTDGVQRANFTNSVIDFQTPIWKVSTQTGAFSPTAAQNYTLFLCTAGTSYTVALPTAVGVAGLRYGFKMGAVTGSSRVTLDGNGAETIDGATTLVLYLQNDYVELESDGANWVIVVDNIKPHFAKLAHSTAQAIADSTTTTIQYDTNIADSPGGLVTTGATANITILRAGNYIISQSFRLNVGDQTIIENNILLGGVAARLDVKSNGTGAAADIFLTNTAPFALSAGNVVSGATWQNSGGSVNTYTGDPHRPVLTVMEIR